MEEVHPFPNPTPSRTFPPRSVQNESRCYSLFWTECGGKSFFGVGMYLKQDRFVLIVSIKTYFVEPVGWRAPVALPNHAVCSAKYQTSYPDFFLPWKNLLCGAGRVVAPNGSRQYHSVCRRDFPMQGDVAPKVTDCSWRKLLTRNPSEGAVCSHYPRRDISIFCVKSFWNS